jgi:hypothetical protein
MFPFDRLITVFFRIIKSIAVIAGTVLYVYPSCSKEAGVFGLCLCMFAATCFLVAVCVFIAYTCEGLCHLGMCLLCRALGWESVYDQESIFAPSGAAMDASENKPL